MSERDWRRAKREEMRRRVARDYRLEQLDAEARQALFHYPERPVDLDRIPHPTGFDYLVSRSWDDARVEIRRLLAGMSTGDDVVFAHRRDRRGRIEVRRTSGSFEVTLVRLDDEDRLFCQRLGIDVSTELGVPAHGSWPSEDLTWGATRLTALLRQLLKPLHQGDIVYGPPGLRRLRLS